MREIHNYASRLRAEGIITPVPASPPAYYFIIYN